MKVRNGFVSNSSSSSFVCSICGEIEAGFDASLDDLDMVECTVGHAMHKACFNKIMNRDRWAAIETAEDGELNVASCPCCTFQALSKDDELAFLRLKAGKTTKELLMEIKDEFSSYTEFSQACAEGVRKDAEEEGTN